jgi:hypothetical protein
LSWGKPTELSAPTSRQSLAPDEDKLSRTTAEHQSLERVATVRAQHYQLCFA